MANRRKIRDLIVFNTPGCPFFVRLYSYITVKRYIFYYYVYNVIVNINYRLSNTEVKKMSNNETKNNVTTNKDSKNAEVKNMSKSILDFNLSNLKKGDVVKRLANSCENITKNAVFVGVYTCYLTGVSIPAYDTNRGVHVMGMKTDGIKMNELCDYPELSKYSRTTLSRYCTAMKLVIDNGDFDKFICDNDRRLSFTYDTIINYYNNKELLKDKGIDSIDKALEKSVRAIKDMVKGDKSDNNKGGNGGSTEEEVTFVYNKVTYSVKKSVMDKFVLTCTKVTK